MNSDLIILVVQIIAALGVVISVIYLGIQIHQQNEITKAQFGHSLTQRLYDRYFNTTKDKEFSLFLSQDWSADDLTNEERWRVNHFIMMCLVDLFDVYDKVENKFVEKKHLDIRINALRLGVMKTEAGISVWNYMKSTRSDKFIEWFEEEIYQNEIDIDESRADKLKDLNIIRTYELSYKRTSTMPLSPFAGEYKPKFLPEIAWAGSKQVFTMDVLNENVNDGNQGTQMDALGHFGYTDEVWNGEGEADLSSLKYFGNYKGKDVKPSPDSPLKKLGIETVPPIITSAVFLDVRKHIFNGKAMKAGEYVTVNHIEETINKSSLKERGILPGDVVLINTGWSDNYQDPDELGVYYSKAPGVSYNLVKYLADKQVVGVGLDTWGVDTFADEDEYGPERSQNPKGIANPAHHYFLTQAGIHTLENFNLKGLAEDNVELSCVIILPLMTEGSSASPIRPVAIGF